MCFLERGDFFIWINLEGDEQKSMLRLRLTEDGKTYRDHFTIEKPLAGGQTELLFTLPFREIADLTYATGDPYCTITFDMVGKPLRVLRVERHCFNLMAVRKMIKIMKKHNQKMGRIDPPAKKPLSDGTESKSGS